MNNEFSVFWTDRDDGQHEELRFVDAQRAVERALRMICGPAALAGFVKRVIITDGGDFTNFEWLYGVGITYPHHDGTKYVEDLPEPSRASHYS